MMPVPDEKAIFLLTSELRAYEMLTCRLSGSPRLGTISHPQAFRADIPTAIARTAPSRLRASADHP